MTSLSHILTHKIIAIIRGANADEVVDIVDALRSGGILTLEITINSPKAIPVIQKLAARYGTELLVGAGTVLDPETARAAILAGAKFIISPTIDLSTIALTRRYGCVSIPGAFTPTEILKAFEHGGDIIKVFPAILGAGYLREISGPLDQIPLMPTGGVNLQNIYEFKQAGAVAFGVGSALVSSGKSIDDSYLKAISQNARAFVEAVSNVPT